MSTASVNYQKLARELVKSLRGDLSQRDLSQRLGYRFNQVGKWETGFKQVKWPDFLNLAISLGLPVEQYFRDYFWNFPAEFNEWTSLECIEDSLHLFLTPMRISKGIKRRWASRQSPPDLADVLKMLDQRPWLLNGWLSQFPIRSALPSLKAREALYRARLEAVFNDPISVYLNAALQVEEYRNLEYHDDRILAEHTTCSVPRLKKCLKNLLSAGIITFDGKKYHPCPYDFSFSSQPHQKLRTLTKYSTDLASSRYSVLPARRLNNKPYNHSASSVRVNAMSDEAAKKVGELVARFHSEVAEIVAQDKGTKQNVQIILLHSFASNINRPEEADESPTPRAPA